MSVKNKKAKGSRAEHKTIAALEARGYSCTRAAGSLGLWDIVATYAAHDGISRVLFIQVKCNHKPGRAEMLKMQQFLAPRCCGKKQLWIWYDHQVFPHIEDIP